MLSEQNGATVVWEGHWEVTEGEATLAAILQLPIVNTFGSDQVLDMIIFFSSPMDTRTVSVAAGMAPEYDDLSVQFEDWRRTSCQSPFFDTWIGTISIPPTGYRESMQVSVIGIGLDGHALKEVVDYSDIDENGHLFMDNADLEPLWVESP